MEKEFSERMVNDLLTVLFVSIETTSITLTIRRLSTPGVKRFGLQPSDLFTGGF